MPTLLMTARTMYPSTTSRLQDMTESKLNRFWPSKFRSRPYLMQLKDGRSIRLLSIGELTGWEAKYEHWLSSLVRTGYRF
jgi:hypothetical protein